MLSMQTLLNYCYYYCSGWTTRLHHIDVNLHFPTLFFYIFTPPLLYIFISCFFYIPLFYFTYYTPFYCGVTDGGWSTWPNLVFYLARVFSYFADFYCTSPSFIASSKKRPYTILGEFFAFILIVYSLVLFSLSLFPLYLLPISLLHARFYSLLGAVHLFVAYLPNLFSSFPSLLPFAIVRLNLFCMIESLLHYFFFSFLPVFRFHYSLYVSLC